MQQVVDIMILARRIRNSKQCIKREIRSIASQNCSSSGKPTIHIHGLINIATSASTQVPRPIAIRQELKLYFLFLLTVSVSVGFIVLPLLLFLTS